MGRATEKENLVNDLPPAAARVHAYAATLGLQVAVTLMAETTRTAEDAAKACGCPVGAIVKSLIFKGKQTGRPILMLVSGANRVNEKAAAEHVGEHFARADADFVRATTGFAIGGIPPFGHDTPIVPYLDADLLQYETVWAAAGTPNAVFEVAPERLREATGAQVIAVT